MDLNCYNLHFAAGLFGEPQEVLYHANVNRGADTSGVVHLIYPDFQCICTGAKDSDGPCELVIQGISTNIEEHLRIIGEDRFISGDYDLTFMGNR